MPMMKKANPTLVYSIFDDAEVTLLANGRESKSGVWPSRIHQPNSSRPPILDANQGVRM